MKEHPSLSKPFSEPPTKPLMESKEITAMARKVLLEQVDAELARLAQSENTQQEILSILKEIREIVTKNSEEDSKTLELKRQVLMKLKAKLETV